MHEIEKYKKIKEMSDGERHWKTLNNIPVEADINDTDTVSQFGKKFHLDKILKRDNIDKAQYESFKNILIETNLISFTTLEDGTISFTIDGFLDNCFGIAYSKSGKQPEFNDCGEIIRWKKIGENWYCWGTT